MKKINLMLFLGLFLIASMSLFVSSATTPLLAGNVTIDTPATSGTLTGATAVFNITIITGYEAQNWSSASVYLKSAGLTANTSDYLIATGWNLTTDLEINGTLDSTQFEDGNDYTITFELNNGTATAKVNVSRTGITINNTIPQAPSSLTPVTNSIISSATTQTFSSTVIDGNTTSCTYVINRGGSSADSKSASGTTTYSASTCSFTKDFSTSLDNGIYYWTITASDESDNVISSEGLLNVQLPGTNGGLPQGTYTTEGKTFSVSSTGELIQNKWWIAVILIVIIGTIVILRKR